jgi:Tol biopolymer transport system component
MRLILAALTLTLAACGASTKKSETASKDAPKPETLSPYISNMRQLTFEGKRAGEGYFSQDGKWLTFQSERESDNPFYQIYVMNVQTGATHRVSPGQGKTTCSWIHPSNKKVLFSSTHHDPELKKKAQAEWEERKNPKTKYNWSFDDAYEIYEASMDGKNLRNLTRAKGYDAEASYSPDGKWIAFASNRSAFEGKMTPEEQKQFERDASFMMDLYIMKSDGTQLKRLTTSPGYDGGPFFSPDGKRLTFRRFSADGHSAEVFTMNIDGTDERQLTHLKAMSWAPFYHPSGDYLIFATNKQGYQNFELYIVDTAGLKPPVRVSALPGFDGLPVFGPDGRTLVWTHSNENGEAQLYRADWDDALARQALGLPLTAPRAKQLAPAIQASDARTWVTYLASEHFAGRMTGSPKEEEYTQALARAFTEMGLKAEVQTYEFTSGIELAENNVLKMQIGDASEQPALSGDWIPLSYSKNGKYPQAPAVFAGYGIVAAAIPPQQAYDSYQDVDVKDKWAVVFSGLPDEVPNERRFHLHIYSRLQHKAMAARQAGAVGLIVVEDTKTPAAPMKLNFEGRADDAGIPVIRVSQKLADRMFSAAGTTRAEWTAKLAKGETSGTPLGKVSLEAEIALKFKKSKARNVIARLNAKSNDHWTTVVGAHLEHGNSLSTAKDAIHYGADDNASGVAAVMEIAHWLSDKVQRGEIKLKQNVIFGLWTGEELGLLGSTHFAQTAKVKSSERISAYVNMDMVGRLRDGLAVQGVGSAKEWRGLVERVSSKNPMKLKMQDDPYLPTDAMAFYMAQYPAISFFTGSHPEYHTGKDTADLLNYEGIAEVSGWIASLTAALAQSQKPLVTYQKVEGGKREGGSRGFRLYLGTIPDYTSEGKPGVAISGTSKNSPAEKAGLLPGDVIVELGGIPIKNIHDYVYCLQALKANQKTKMRVLRAGKEKQLEITPELKTQQ